MLPKNLKPLLIPAFLLLLGLHGVLIAGFLLPSKQIFGLAMGQQAEFVPLSQLPPHLIQEFSFLEENPPLLQSPQKNLLAKAGASILSFRQKKELRKGEVATALNTLYFGEGIYGIQAAAGHYFGKAASQLTPHESATLAGIYNIYSPDAPDGW